MEMLIGAVVFAGLWTVLAFIIGTIIGKGVALRDKIEGGRR